MRHAQLTAIETNRIRSDARRQRDLPDHLFIETDVHEELARGVVPRGRHVARLRDWRRQRRWRRRLRPGNGCDGGGAGGEEDDETRERALHARDSTAAPTTTTSPTGRDRVDRYRNVAA